MDCAGTSAQSFVQTLRRILPSLLIIWVTLAGGKAGAERLSFRSYGAADGLTSLGNTCNALAGPGYLLICSEHGVFFYDGRLFHNLGASQGLADGGFADDIALTQDGRVAVRFPDKLFVSDGPVSRSRSPSSLTFRPVDLGTTKLFSNFTHQMVPVRNGLALITGRDTVRIDLSPGAAARVAPIDYDPAERAMLAGAAAIFQVDQHLWETFEDGRICSADPGLVRCYAPSQGPARERWHDIVKGAGDSILARSDDSIATIEPRDGSVRIEHLPDQGGPYDGYAHALGLFRTPGGALITQSAHGLLIGKGLGWIALSGKDGIPAGTITSIVVDRSGQLWLQVFGRGLFRGLNYGHWEGFQQEDGLSVGAAWAAVRAGGSLWVATDTGVDEIKRVDGVLQAVSTRPGVSYTVLNGPDGTIWSGAGKRDVIVVRPDGEAPVRLALPLLNCAVVTGRSRVWLGTAHGLYHVDMSPGRPLTPVRDATTDVIDQISSDGSDGVWIIQHGRIWHVHADGRLAMLSGQWPEGEFQPFALATDQRGHLWVGGAGGLYDVVVSADRIVRMDAIPPSDIRTNAVVALMVDRRGWVWAGTGQGVSVFNGHRWVSTDADMGLVWDDVSEGGLFDDPDGSVWIATSLGVSHLLDPEWLFAAEPVEVAISQASLGQSPVPAGRLPYTDAPLSLQFGTLTFGSERSIVFRYKLSGVDKDWDESTTGTVRYASIPPGHHVLTLVGYDNLSHVASEPVTLVIDMAYPWWRTWWADAFYVLAVLLALHGFARFRDRTSAAAQRKLEVLVEERTREMQIAQAELKHQASVDSLTGLLNRREVRQRLQDRLAAVETKGETLIAMLDVDHFKRVNDGHGHLVGDELLCAIGVRVSAVLRDGECAGRFGGEEFILVLGDRDGQGADRILVLHQMIRQNPFHLTAVSISVTCSIGLAWAGPGDDWTSLIGRADAALYEAKTSGRDKVMESHDDQALLSPPHASGQN
jgi:diguanylate cyclase (GGDEF)-like protein